MKLFREQVAAANSDRLQGTIDLSSPLSWKFVTAGLAATFSVAALVATFASYSRTEAAYGTIMPEKGLLSVVSQRAGTVAEIGVVNGERVQRGRALLQIRTEEADRNGALTQSAVLAAIEKQTDSIRDQSRLGQLAMRAEQAEYDAQISGFRAELESLETRISTQQKLLTMAKADYARAAEVATRGFISRHDMSQREETVLSRSQELASLQQERASKASALLLAGRAKGEAAAKAAEAAATLRSSRAQIERERADAQGARGNSLVAPVDGVVAAVDAHPGDPVRAGDQLMMIVPDGAAQVARIYVPESAAGFVRRGQEVRVSVDAYPSDRFGTIPGRIDDISTAPMVRQGRDGKTAAFYIATARLQRQTVHAYGRDLRILPGMAFNARIQVERRSLIQWLFDPLFAAARQ